MTDVSERKLAEQVLRRSDAYLAEAQRLNRTGSWALKPGVTKPHYWSDEMFRIWGVDPQHWGCDVEANRYKVSMHTDLAAEVPMIMADRVQVQHESDAERG